EFSRHTSVPAIVEMDGTPDHLTDSQQTCIYRVVQEALTNCARHAKAKKVLVSVMTHKDKIEVVVKDDGVGFNPFIANKGGLGLLGIRERVEALDGTVRISSQPNKGTLVQVQIPVGAAA